MFNPNFNPAQVMMGNRPGAPTTPAKGTISGPYMPVKPIGPEKPTKGPETVLGSDVVRATGSGPFDQAYRQNLATYAGGQMQNPGFLGINPTGQIAGNPTGGGSAPVQGLPNDLLSMALGGQSFSFTPPAAKHSPNANSVSSQSWQNWLHNIMGNKFGIP